MNCKFPMNHRECKLYLNKAAIFFEKPTKDHPEGFKQQLRGLCSAQEAE